MADYDYVIVNDNLVVAVAQVAAILDAEARRVSRQDTLVPFIQRLSREVRELAEKMGGPEQS